MVLQWNTGSQTVTTTDTTDDTVTINGSGSSWKYTQADNSTPLGNIKFKVITRKSDSLFGGTSDASTILSDNTFTSSNMKFFLYVAATTMELYIDGSGTGDTLAVSDGQTYTIDKTGTTITITKDDDSSNISGTLSTTDDLYMYASAYANDGAKFQFLAGSGPASAGTLLPPPVAWI